MRSRLFRPTLTAALALVVGALILTSPAVPSRAQDPKGKAEAADPLSEQMRKAIVAANEQDFPKAITAVEAAGKLDPKARPPVMLLAVFATRAADSAKTTAAKLAYLRKSTAAYARLRALEGPMSPQEESFGGRSKLDEARILALEGKTRPALDAILKLVEGGYDDFDEIEEQPDLKPVRDLPAYQARVKDSLQTKINTEIAATKAFPFDFDLKDTAGKAVKLADFKGNVTIVDIWGTWCPPCRKEIPHFVDLAAKYDAQGLRIVGINCNEEGTPAEVAKTVDAFKAENKMKYPCLINDDTVEKKVPDFQGYPTTLFLDRAGKVRLVLVGYTAMNRLDLIVSTLLAEPAPK